MKYFLFCFAISLLFFVVEFLLSALPGLWEVYRFRKKRIPAIRTACLLQIPLGVSLFISLLFLGDVCLEVVLAFVASTSFELSDKFSTILVLSGPLLSLLLMEVSMEGYRQMKDETTDMPPDTDRSQEQTDSLNLSGIGPASSCEEKGRSKTRRNLPSWIFIAFILFAIPGLLFPPALMLAVVFLILGILLKLSEIGYVPGSVQNVTDTTCAKFPSWIAIASTLFAILGLFFPSLLILSIVFLFFGKIHLDRGNGRLTGGTFLRVSMGLLVVSFFYHGLLPSFREAQDRATIAGLREDMKPLLSALETYQVDHNAFPPSLTPFLTTPVAYLQEIPRDPFSEEGAPIQYYAPANGGCILTSMGPNRKYDIDLPREYAYPPDKSLIDKVCDPSYETNSSGDVVWMYLQGEFFISDFPHGDP